MRVVNIMVVTNRVWFQFVYVGLVGVHVKKLSWNNIVSLRFCFYFIEDFISSSSMLQITWSIFLCNITGLICCP